MWRVFMCLVVLAYSASDGTAPAPAVVPPTTAESGGTAPAGGPKALVVYLIRHAESTWNEAKAKGFLARAAWFAANLGGCDAELTERGITQTRLWSNMQAAGLGQEIHTAVTGSKMTYFSSPLQRPYQTISALHATFGGTAGADVLHVCPVLRETANGPDAKSHVMWQCRGLGKTDDGGTLQERVDKFLKGGRSLPSLATDYGATWASLHAISDKAGEEEYRVNREEVNAEYFWPFLEDLFTNTPEGNAALVATHGHWIQSFAEQVAAGIFGAAPTGGNWGSYATKEGRVANAHIIKLTITRAPKAAGGFEYTFDANIVEQPPRGTPVAAAVAASFEPSVVNQWGLLGGCVLLGLVAFGLGRRCAGKQGDSYIRMHDSIDV